MNESVNIKSIFGFVSDDIILFAFLSWLGLFVNELHPFHTISHFTADKTLATVTFVGSILLFYNELQYIVRTIVAMVQASYLQEAAMLRLLWSKLVRHCLVGFYMI